MHRRGSSRARRFAAAALFSLPLTVALLFLMTRLILPSEHDRIVTRMIQNIEFLRIESPPDPAGIHVYELPKAVEEEPPINEPNPSQELPDQSQTQSQASNEIDEQERPAHVIDWWAEARRLTQELDEKALERWLLEQGYDRYVSIMQGPLPITNSVRGTLPPSQEDVTGYLNTYGDLEFRISENCVIQTQVSARLDASDFVRNLPMRVVCKSAPKQKFTFRRPP